MTDKKGGASVPVMESYQTLFPGRQTVGNAAVRLNIGTRVTSFTCIVQSGHSNAANSRVLIGNQNVQPFELEPGESVSIPVGANGIWVRALAGNLIVNWMAGG